ncbi:MAG: helix-turn-helix transcriptional regulator [Duncaniella sp.]|nr:helix-turn-helix transcriptional regulator [Duncaniella sp.]MDE7146183.1 helix-turn-helix transcriptional regulator [Duncaniella sp.]
MNKADDFFYSGNTAGGNPDYGLADTFVRTAEAFANTTYQSVYIIDYYRKNFLYVSPNPLFLCGMSPKKVKALGYQFYLDHVPADEIDMLLEINQAGFSFINRIPSAERKKYTIFYDFHIVNGHKKLLINHKLTGLAYQPDGSVWLGLSVVSLSTHSKAGQITMHCRDRAGYWEYDLALHRWEEHSAPVLNETEKVILTLSIQGLTINAIAEKAHLAVDSVKSARRRLFEKLEVNNISEAISCAINYKLL